MKIKLFIEFTRDKELFLNTDCYGREIFIYSFVNCNLSGHSLYYPEVLIETNKSLMLPYHEMTMSLKRGTRYESEGMEYNLSAYDESLMIIIDDPVFFFIYNTDNYFHFLYDTLPYLISFSHLKKKEKSIKLLMNYPNSRKQEFYLFVKEFLDLLDINSSDIIIANPTAIYKKIYISSSFTHNGLSDYPPRKEIYELYNDLVVRSLAKKDKFSNIYKNIGDNIYISRRTWVHNDLSNIGTNYTTRRMMMNEDKLVNVLTTKYNFKEVFTENISTIDKILLFHNAKIVIGAIGGGISNVLFSKPSTKLIAIVSPCFLDINKRFHFSLNNVQVSYLMDTKLFDVVDGFSKYIRVKNIHSDMIGEVIEIQEDSCSLKVAIGNSHGWNNELQYTISEFKYNDIIKLDDGLNSPYVVNIEALCNSIDKRNGE